VRVEPRHQQAAVAAGVAHYVVLDCHWDVGESSGRDQREAVVDAAAGIEAATDQRQRPAVARKARMATAEADASDARLAVGSEPARLRLSVDAAGLEIVLHVRAPTQPARQRRGALRGQGHAVAPTIVLPSQVAVMVPARREAQREHEAALLALVEVLLCAGIK